MRTGYINIFNSSRENHISLIALRTDQRTGIDNYRVALLLKTGVGVRGSPAVLM